MTATRPSASAALRPLIDDLYLGDEVTLVHELCAQLDTAATDATAVSAHAAALVSAVRADEHSVSALDRFIGEYGLDSREGVLLMCLAEAFQRVPDAHTADALISDKLAWADWSQHLDNEDFLVHAATWAFMLGGRVLPAAELPAHGLREHLLRLVARAGEPLVRAAVAHAMRVMGEQFVMASDINTGVSRAMREREEFERYSYDILGEAALTRSTAAHYAGAYAAAIDHLAALPPATRRLTGISVKLSALYPRYEPAHGVRAGDALHHALLDLAARAAAIDVQLTVDAEESARLGLSLEIFERVRRAPALAGWHGLGLAVQAYQKRAPRVIAWLGALAEECGHTIPVRLVKGAYWDTEIKQAQIDGLAEYPVYTRKCHTDVAYLVCARQLLLDSAGLYPQFATHNAHTIASVVMMAGEQDYEFQRLHGMGEALYRALNSTRDTALPCRVYAPIGDHAALLPYLVRRLLENGANTSFVHRINDRAIPIDDIVHDPITASRGDGGPRRHRHIPLPADLFAPRRNAAGHNFADTRANARLIADIEHALTRPARATPIVNGEPCSGTMRTVHDPADHRRAVGEVTDASSEHARAALAGAVAAWPQWAAKPADARAALLERAADRFEQQRAELIAVIVRECGRRVVDAQAEVREAVDFLRFYAAEARRLFATPEALPGPAGERNSSTWRARGVFCCISPWNFPVAIFTGQIAAALAAGNTVIAKPAEQASLCGALVTTILHEAGIPGAVLQFLPGDGPALGQVLLSDARIAGVAFTGSETTAQQIAATLTARAAPPAVLIAETGGVNALLADSSALLEQLVHDVVESAFNSAGQRCSALRILALQEDIAAPALTLLRGAMHELVIGDPLDLATDIGPLIDNDSCARIRQYLEQQRADGRILEQLTVPPDARHGHFVAPSLVEVNDVSAVSTEVFGPVLHVCRFASDALEATVDAVNALGYGLTFGIHSRITQRAEALAARSRAGNVYINRNLIGAVVEAQPFGGRGRSGTGPKAGGRHYVQRFASEQTLSINSAAAGGNADLIGLDD